MADGIKMSYSDMDTISGELNAIVGEIIGNKNQMISKVNTLCESWDSMASQRHQDEFTNVANNIDKLTTMVDELITSIKNYRADMESLDQSYA
ncbi:MAG: WXG100 family type VII secretion target [Lachnospiraceae bacterium]|nr:WXG100 family type VII secretion target [Lachnospiraceae bacterium]